MKRKTILSVFSLVVLLGSCSSAKGMTIEEATDFAKANFGSTVRDTYSVESWVKALSRPLNKDEFDAYYQEDDLSYNEDEDKNLDYWVNVPLRMTGDDFYSVGDDGAAGGKYGLIYNFLTYQPYNSLDKIEVEKNDLGGLTFSCKGKFARFDIKEYYVYGADFGGRINGEIQYDSDGYLRLIDVESVNWNEDKYADDDSMLKIHCAYSYPNYDA